LRANSPEHPTISVERVVDVLELRPINEDRKTDRRHRESDSGLRTESTWAAWQQNAALIVANLVDPEVPNAV
jgi:hypothetical protein